jgi:hypothetical protein
MKRIKSFLYNNQTDYIVALVVIVVIGALYYITSIQMVGYMIVFPFIYTICNLIINKKNNRKYRFFNCNYFLFSKKKVWINQKVKIRKKLDKCPKGEFVKEMTNLLNQIPKDTVCYCYTHDLIKNQIQKKCSIVDIELGTEKNLINLKRKLKVTECDSCPNIEECSLFKDEQTQFYSIKFYRDN